MKQDLETAQKVFEVIDHLVQFLADCHANTEYEPLKTIYARLVDGVDILARIDCEGTTCQIPMEDINGLVEQMSDLEAEISCLELEIMTSEEE